MYEHQEFPKWLFHSSTPAVIVESKEEQDALGGDWYESPALVPGVERVETELDRLAALRASKKAKAK